MLSSDDYLRLHHAEGHELRREAARRRLSGRHDPSGDGAPGTGLIALVARVVTTGARTLVPRRT